MEKTFEEYLKQSRIDLCEIAQVYTIDEHRPLRTRIDSLLIAYDQAAEKALRPSISEQENYDQGFHDGANKTAIELSKIDTVNLDYALIQKCSVCSVQLHPIHGANCLAPNCPNENYNGNN
tara:strand:+ start:793 stop:1155 length:363 start_codon:yes stop_codon:yes gene_type:complete